MKNASARRLQVSAKVVPSFPILVILMMETICSSETSVLTRPRGVTFQKTAFFILNSLLHPRNANAGSRLRGYLGMNNFFSEIC
jgi:hypothetical protein